MLDIRSPIGIVTIDVVQYVRDVGVAGLNPVTPITCPCGVNPRSRVPPVIRTH
jgi:hypothetical protein